ncbi:hypothetical protein BpHYR1_022490 [Brachionus plicatilis]|uniref:Uncharacterized protein n=1 Tax=Brachionus plicatilis TaxID=10195 RepID=A0A3M7PZK2_BRAPC|nr:hypothetical protein BpHYR1_022490 [Brachionus plicatilis]
MQILSKVLEETTNKRSQMNYMSWFIQIRWFSFKCYFKSTSLEERKMNVSFSLFSSLTTLLMAEPTRPVPPKLKMLNFLQLKSVLRAFLLSGLIILDLINFCSINGRLIVGELLTKEIKAKIIATICTNLKFY